MQYLFYGREVDINVFLLFLLDNLWYLRPPPPGDEPGGTRNKRKNSFKQFYFNFKACTDIINASKDGYCPPIETLGALSVGFKVGRSVRIVVDVPIVGS